MNLDALDDDLVKKMFVDGSYDVTSDLMDADKWILSRKNKVIADVTNNLEKFELGVAAQKINDFIWEELCDWYIEMIKPRLYGEDVKTKAAAVWTLSNVLIDSLKLLHPYMPFVTEEIYCTLLEEEGILEDGKLVKDLGRERAESIMISEWPKYDEKFAFEAEEEAVELIMEAVKAVRTVRTDMNVPPSRKAKIFVVSENAKTLETFEKSRLFFEALAGASETSFQADKSGIGEDAVSAMIHTAALYIPFADLVDIEKELERLSKEKARLEGEIKRCNGMLSNPNFTGKAPAAKIEEEKGKLAKYTDMLAQVEERLTAIKR